MRLSRSASASGRALKRYAASEPAAALTWRKPDAESISACMSSAETVNAPDSRSASSGCGGVSETVAGVVSTVCSDSTVS